MKIVCLGDSLTRGYGVKPSQAWPSLLGQKSNSFIFNKGINGDTTGGMLARFYQDVITNKPSYVIITGGGNDLFREVPLTVVKDNINAMVQQSLHYNIIPVIGIPVPIEVEKARQHWESIQNLHQAEEIYKDYEQWIIYYGKNVGVEVVNFRQLFINENNRVKSDYYIDGLHLTTVGHEMMCDLVMAKLKLIYSKAK